MREIRLHYPTGHPYWQKNEFKVEVDGTFIDVFKFNKKYYIKSYEIFIEQDGVYVHYCACGSGFGKFPISEKFLLVKCKLSDITLVGEPLEIPNELRREINALGHR